MGIDHLAINEMTENITTAIKNLKDISYDKNIVLEYNIPALGSDYDERLKNWIVSANVIMEAFK